mgnify:CR=1 FL=1
MVISVTLISCGVLNLFSDGWKFFMRVFFFQAEDGIRDLVRSRGLGDVHKRQVVKMKLMPSLKN